MEFPSQDRPAIIAIKGLPFSGNEHIYCNIAAWARCPVFKMKTVLLELYKGGGYVGSSKRPPVEEDERLQHLAFTILCQIAASQALLPGKKLNCVIIDSSLSSTSQLDELIQTVVKFKVKLLIIECRIRHKYTWQQRANHYIKKKDWLWFMPKSWDEVEKAMEKYDAKAWDDRFLHHCSTGLHLKRIVLDPYFDIRKTELLKATEDRRVSAFGKAIEYLLTDEKAPPVVDLRKWRKQQMGMLLSSTDTKWMKREDLCSKKGGDCKFIYTKDDDHVVDKYCKACQKQFTHPTKGAYMCASCGLLLHQSCANFPINRPYHDRCKLISQIYRPRDAYGFPIEPTCAPNLCTHSSSKGGGGFSYECRSCIFEAHLKYQQVSTVVEYPHLHQHPLSIQLTSNYEEYGGVYRCELCSLLGYFCSYYCGQCNMSYHLRCIHSPLQVEHEHGGYHHLMELRLPTSTAFEDDDNHTVDLKPEEFSREKYMEEDELWCDICFNEIDQDAACYQCSDCPDCVAHIYCISHLWKGVDIIDSVF